MAKKNMRHNEEVDANLDMSPMIDCCFLLLIFFVVNATALSVSKDPNVRMPSAISSSDLEDANGCIVVNIFNNFDKMSPKAQQNFLKAKYTAETRWATPDNSSGGTSQAYTEDDTQLLTEYVTKQRELLESRGIDPAQIRIYLRGDADVPWEHTATAIRCAATAGVTNIIFGTLPAK